MDAPFTPEEVEAIASQVKRELRKRMRSLRGALSAETRAERSRSVVQALAALDVFEGASVVGLYAPMVERGELDVEPLHPIFAERGISVAYPRIREDGSLAFHRVDDRTSLEERGNRFREPPDDPATEVTALDALVVPALAADPLGNRLGYGGGSYDRTLAAFARAPRTVAVVYDFQVLVEVPHVATDIPVDVVLTDRRSFRRDT
jgi:5-formyltetrahydrofolate cyclo-ligase